MGVKKFLIGLLLIISVQSFSQVLQKPSVYGYQFRRLVVDTLFALPADTFSVPAALQSYPFLAKKGTSLYLWNTSTLVWAAVGGAGTTPTLQQVLTAGSTLTTSNSINGGGYDLTFDNNSVFGATAISGSNYGQLEIVTDNATLQVVSPAATSAVDIHADSLFLLPHLGRLIIDSLNYTLSTTGKKIMLRDTATGLVQNIDPALIGGSTAISSLTAATGTNTIDNGGFMQRWDWNSLAEDIGLFLRSTATNGISPTLFSSTMSGVHSNPNITSISGNFTNQHTGTSSTNIAGQFIASGGTNNYAIIVPASSGSVGIGTSTPTSLLHVNGTAQFGTAGSQIGRLHLSGNTSGTVGITTAAAAGTWTMTLPTDDGTSGQYLQTDGAGVTSWQTVSGSASLDTNVTTSMNGRTSMKQILQGSDSLVVLGDSYSTGAYGEWYSLFAKRFGLEAGTLALSGSGIYYAAKQANANITAANSKVLSALVGFNDLRRSSSDATYRKVAGCSRSIIASNLVNVVSTAASVTTSGTWTTFTGTTYGGRSGVAGGAYNNVSGSYKEYTATGANFIIGYFSQAAVGFTGGEIDISVDGTVIKHLVLNEADGVSDGVYDNNLCPGAYFISGLSTGSHTIRITNTTNNYVYLDYFSTVKLPSASQPVLFSLIPYMPQDGYIQSPSNGSNTSFNRGNDSIINSVNAFTGWPVSFVPINTYADTTLGMDADDIHRNVLGNQQIADAFSSAVVPGVAVPATTTLQTATDAGATTTNSISVGTSTAPPTVLYVRSSNPNVRIDDSNGDNSAHYGNYLNFAQLGVNRNPSSGVFTNTAKTAQQISLEGSNGVGSISFYTTNTNNTAPTERLKLFGNGNLNLAQKFLIGDLVSTPTAWLHLPASTATANSGQIKLTDGVRQTTGEDGVINRVGSNVEFTVGTTPYIFSKTLVNSATLDFGSTSASSSSDLTITVTGAADGDVVSIGVANAAINANSCYTAWVSSANTVTIRFNNYQSVGSIDPASATFKVSVIK